MQPLIFPIRLGNGIVGVLGGPVGPGHVTRAGCILANLDSHTNSSVVQSIAELHNRSPLSSIFLATSPATRLVVQLLRMGAVEILDWPVGASRLESVVAEACRDSIAR